MAQKLDKNGTEIFVGDSVDVPYPTSEDNWNNEFNGHVEKIDDDYIIVMDGDGDTFAIENERLEVTED